MIQTSYSNTTASSSPPSTPSQPSLKPPSTSATPSYTCNLFPHSARQTLLACDPAAHPAPTSLPPALFIFCQSQAVVLRSTNQCYKSVEGGLLSALSTNVYLRLIRFLGREGVFFSPSRWRWEDWVGYFIYILWV